MQNRLCNTCKTHKPRGAFRKRHRQCAECDRKDFISMCIAKTTTNTNKKRIGRYHIILSDPSFKEFNFIVKTSSIINPSELNQITNTACRKVIGTCDVYTSFMSAQEYLWFETNVPRLVLSNTPMSDIPDHMVEFLTMNLQKRVKDVS